MTNEDITKPTKEIYPNCILVGDDRHSDLFMELPIEKNGSILLSTIQAQFPSAMGLRFKVSAGLWRGVRIRDNVLDPPFEGWGDHRYVITTPHQGNVQVPTAVPVVPTAEPVVLSVEPVVPSVDPVEPVVSQHPKLKDFKQCVTCEKEFSSKSALKRHKKIHKFDGPFEPVVPSVAPDASAAVSVVPTVDLDHNSAHSSENPFKCTQCDKDFSQDSDLKKHKILHTSSKKLENYYAWIEKLKDESVFGEKSAEHVVTPTIRTEPVAVPTVEPVVSTVAVESSVPNFDIEPAVVDKPAKISIRRSMLWKGNGKVKRVRRTPQCIEAAKQRHKPTKPIESTVGPAVPTVEPVIPNVEPVLPTAQPVVPNVEPVIGQHPEPKDIRQCVTCGKEFTSKNALKRHKKVHKFDNCFQPVVPVAVPVVPTIEPVVPTVGPVPPTAEPVIPAVNFAVPTVKPVVPTIQPVVPIVEPVVGQHPKPKDIKQCVASGKEFTYKNALKSHKKIHKFDNPFQPAVPIAVSVVHTIRPVDSTVEPVVPTVEPTIVPDVRSDEPVVVPAVGRVGPAIVPVVLTVVRQHPKPKDVIDKQCGICGMGFNSKNALKSHKKIHKFDETFENKTSTSTSICWKGNGKVKTIMRTPQSIEAAKQRRQFKKKE